MKEPHWEYNLAISTNANILRVHRRINVHLSRGGIRGIKSGDSRYRMAYRANARRLDEKRQFRFNAFRNPIRGARRPVRPCVK